LHNGYPYVDTHVHGHEYPREELAVFTGKAGLVLVAVSDDYESSRKTIEAARKLQGIVPCVGVHPWTVDELGRNAIEEARKVIDLAVREHVSCLGEIGLDTKFVGRSIDLQREVFHLFLEAARDYGLRLNLHTAGTWREVYDLIVRYDIGYANFHWYTGPLDLIEPIVHHGFTLSINPAVKIQRKHREVVKAAPLEALLTESDGPYRYRSIEMNPLLVPEVVAEIASIKGLEDVEAVRRRIYTTFAKKWLS